MNKCEGCLTYDSKIEECHEGFIISDECPCRGCLIKMICKTSCEPFAKFYQKGHGISQENTNE